MNDEANDVTIDQMFYVKESQPEGCWILYDCDEESARFKTLPEMRAFILGLWRGMSIQGEVDLTCAIFNTYGILLDMLVSKT
jgi:hypothetical protein